MADPEDMPQLPPRDARGGRARSQGPAIAAAAVETINRIKAPSRRVVELEGAR